MTISVERECKCRTDDRVLAGQFVCQAACLPQCPLLVLSLSSASRCLLVLLCADRHRLDPTLSLSAGDMYSVMTRAGPKHFVAREDISDDIVVNPSDGSCAQQ